MPTCFSPGRNVDLDADSRSVADRSATCSGCRRRPRCAFREARSSRRARRRCRCRRNPTTPAGPAVTGTRSSALKMTRPLPPIARRRRIDGVARLRRIVAHAELVEREAAHRRIAAREETLGRRQVAEAGKTLAPGRCARAASEDGRRAVTQRTRVAEHLRRSKNDLTETDLPIRINVRGNLPVGAQTVFRCGCRARRRGCHESSDPENDESRCGGTRGRSERPIRDSSTGRLSHAGSTAAGNEVVTLVRAGKRRSTLALQAPPREVERRPVLAAQTVPFTESVRRPNRTAVARGTVPTEAIFGDARDRRCG